VIPSVCHSATKRPIPEYIPHDDCHSCLKVSLIKLDVYSPCVAVPMRCCTNSIRATIRF
jgi:hypothetical protein